MITPVILRDGNELLLCATHRRLADVVSVRPAVPGAAWKCRICTIHRRLTQGEAEAVSVIVPSDSGAAPHVVTRVPTGIVHCDCLAWRFQRGAAPANRWCKHVERSGLKAGGQRSIDNDRVPVVI